MNMSVNDLAAEIQRQLAQGAVGVQEGQALQ